MNVLFITLADIKSVRQHGIYEDLLREFAKNGHEVYVVSPLERRNCKMSTIIAESADNAYPGVTILKVRTGNIQKTGFIEKGVSTLLLEYQLTRSIKRYFGDIKFNLVLYSTPPVTIVKPIKYVKKKCGAKTYLLLKDITPQAMVDLGAIKTRGPTGMVYNYFKKKEKQLYVLSDCIGCMSQANVDYVIAHNPEVDPRIVEICPNSIEVVNKRIMQEERMQIRDKYGIPQDKTVFVYGGNLGKPQGIPFIIECLKSQKNNPNAFFLIVGSGTEFGKLQAWFDTNNPANMKLMRSLPKEDYDHMVAACDVGMIFLDHRFTIPNFPSRLLSYMQAGLPVLCCTDPNTDIGKVVVDGGFGWWCESNDVNAFAETVGMAEKADRVAMGNRGMAYLQEHYTVEKSYETMMKGL